MANEPTWINFKADDLSTEQRALHDAMLKARAAFEASFPVRDGFTLRFSYKGADFDRMGVTEVAKPKDKAAVAGNLAAWIASQKANGARH